MKQVDRILMILLAVSMLVSIYVSIERINLEKKNNHVELAVDYTALRELSLKEGLTETDLVSMFKKAGITGLAFSEDTFENLKLQGLMKTYAGEDLLRAFNSKMEKFPAGLSIKNLPPLVPTKLYIAVYDKNLLIQLKCFLAIFCGKEKAKLWYYDENTPVSIENPVILEVTGIEKELNILGIGFPKETIEKYQKMGLHIILRPENKKTVTSKMIADYKTALMNFKPIYAIIFSGPDNDVLGYPDYLEDSVNLIKNLDCYLGLIEAPNTKSLQKGIQTLGTKCAPVSLRVQSVSPLFQEKLTLEDLIGKFELGARERNIRIIYIRPFTRPYKEKNLLETNIFYIESMKNALTAKGLYLGDTYSCSEFNSSTIIIFILSLGTLCAFILLMRKMMKTPEPAVFIMVIIWAVLFALFFFTHHLSLWNKLNALVCGLTIPTLAIIANIDNIKKSIIKNSFVSLLVSSTVALLRVTIFTLTGGLIMSAMLSSTEFFLQIDRFRGIKFLMILPPLIVTLYYVLKESSTQQRLSDLLQIPIRAWHLILFCILGGAGIYYIIRTGNASEATTSNLELSLRAFLNKVMLVRPRFKEFLLGYPALMLFSAFLKNRFEKGVWLLILLAGIGQADIIDTLAHLHTPLVISLIRILNGFLLGWVFGAIMLFIFWKTAKKEGKI